MKLHVVPWSPVSLCDMKQSTALPYLHLAWMDENFWFDQGRVTHTFIRLYLWALFHPLYVKVC